MASGYTARLSEICMRSLTLLTLLLACNDGSSKGPASPAAAPTAPSAATPAAPAASGDIADTQEVATWKGGALTYGPVRAQVGKQLLKQEVEYLSTRYETQSQQIDDEVNKAILDAEAKKRGLADAQALLKAEVEEKVSAPTDAEIQDAYAQLQRRLGGKPLEEVREQVARAVTQKKQAERYGAYIEELRKSYDVKVTLPFPDLPRFEVATDGDPSEGAADAAVTIVQFAEFQCPYCGKADQTVKQVLKNYDGKVRVVFRDFPLGFHQNAIPAAIAANCADKQGKYWEMHAIFLANQQALTEADIQKAAQEVGLNVSSWEECRKDPAIEAEIRSDMADGSALGVEGTPAFFVNGIFLNGAQPYESFQRIIDRELAAKKG